MCRDRECGISNTTPCVFVFGVGSSITKKKDNKPKQANTGSWHQNNSGVNSQQHPNSGVFSKCTKPNGISSLGQTDRKANPWSQKTAAVNNIMDPQELLTLSERKQKNLSDNCLHKKTVIFNTIRHIQKGRCVDRILG